MLFAQLLLYARITREQLHDAYVRVVHFVNMQQQLGILDFAALRDDNLVE